MIRRTKKGDKFKWIETRRNYNNIIQKFVKEYEEIFVNDKYFIHNDVGVAWLCDSGVRSWYWNGYLVQ